MVKTRLLPTGIPCKRTAGMVKVCPSQTHAERKNMRTIVGIAELAAMKSHEIDWTTANVINSVANTCSRKVKEVLHIARKVPRMNKDLGMKCSTIWHPLGVH